MVELQKVGCVHQFWKMVLGVKLTAGLFLTRVPALFLDKAVHDCITEAILTFLLASRSDIIVMVDWA